MIILKPIQTMLFYMGLLYTYSNSYWYKMYGYCWIIFTFSFFLPMSAYFIKNFSNINQSSDLIILTSAEIMTMAKLIFFVNNKNFIKNLLRNLQKNFDDKIYQNRGKPYRIAEYKALRISKIYYRTLMFSAIASAVTPIINVLYHLQNNTLSDRIWRHPYSVIFPYDYKSSPGYEITYIICILIGIVIVGHISAIDTFFVGTCLHIIACLKDLKIMFYEADRKYSNAVNSIIYTKINKRHIDNELRRNLIKCISFHNEIIGFMAKLSSISSGLIFTEFFSSIVLLGTIAFQTQLSANRARDQIINYIGMCLSILLELFIYCYYGNQLTAQANSVADSIYQTNWYIYPIKQKKYIQAILLRTQRPKYLIGLKFVNCSLQSFTTVLNTAGSMLAVFRNINVKEK